MESSFVYEFVGGLKSQRMKDIIAETNYGSETPSMWEIANHASQFESRSAVIKGATKVKNVVSILTVRSEKAVRKREKPLTPNKDEEEGGGRGGARKSVRPRPTVHAVQCSEPEVKHWKYK